MRIIILRHGQTEWNALQRYQGQTDIPLNDTGREQAYQVVRLLKEQEAVQAIYCSDLSRASETAQIIGDSLGINPISDARLRELSFGVWEGLTFTEVYGEYRQEFDDWFQDTQTYTVPGGESLQCLMVRVLEVISEIEQTGYQSVLVVTHGGVMKAVLGYADEETDLWADAIANAAMITMELTVETRLGIKVTRLQLCQ